MSSECHFLSRNYPYGYAKMLRASFTQSMEIIFEDRCLVVRSDVLNALLVSDIHLGFRVELEHRTGISYPPDHPLLLNQLQAIVKKHSVSALYIIGDLKHTIVPDNSYDWEIIPEFMTMISRDIDTTIIPGNHDGSIEGLLPRKVGIADVHGLTIGHDSDTLGLLHGHAWPSADVLRSSVIVVGHNHPSLNRIRTVSARLNGRQNRRRSVGFMPVVLRSRLNKNCVRMNIGEPEDLIDSEGILITLPSFNPLISGIQVNLSGSRLQGPIFETGCAELRSSEVYSVDGVFLGTVDTLQASVDETIK